MRKTKMPGRAGTSHRAGQIERRSKMPTSYLIKKPTKRQWRQFIVECIEFVIAVGIVAAVIWLAGVLLKACGVM